MRKLPVSPGVVQLALKFFPHYNFLFYRSVSVLRAKVIRDRWDGRYKGHHRGWHPRYDILVSTVWKGQHSVENVLNTSLPALVGRKKRVGRWLSHIYTSPGVCAVPLQVGTKYVLTGKIYQNKLYITTCNWRTISNKFSRGIRKLFKSGLDCNCSVQYCFGRNSCAPQRRNLLPS